MKPTVVLTAELPEIATAILSQECEVVTHAAEGTRSEEEMIAILAEADAAVTMPGDPLTRRVLESNVNLRAIANYAVGVNNIDLEAAQALGITVTNTPGVLTGTEEAQREMARMVAYDVLAALWDGRPKHVVV